MIKGKQAKGTTFNDLHGKELTMVTTRQLNTRMWMLLAVAVVLVALVQGQVVTWAEEPDAAERSEEGRTINAGTMEGVILEGSNVNPLYTRRACTSAFVPTNGAISLRCCCGGFDPLVYSCGINAVNNVGRFVIRDAYPFSSSCCQYRLNNIGPGDFLQAVIVCD
jgi:hypothetical protein